LINIRIKIIAKRGLIYEGVETKECLNHFSDLNCEYIQGYYFSKPISENEFIEFIKNSLKISQPIKKSLFLK
jgi:EAL domain-containing protein (putative c-di-GMP-specific phosphodiesterase class I)